MLVFCDDAEGGLMQLAWSETSLLFNAHPTAPYAFDGTYGLINQNSGHWNKKILATNYTELFFSVFFLMTGDTASGRLLSWFSAGSTELGSIRWNGSTKKLEIYIGTTFQVSGTVTQTHSAVGGGYFNLNVRVLLHGSTGEVAVRHEGSTTADAVFSGNTLPSGSNMNAFAIGALGASLGVVADCFWVNDTAGGVNDSWPGVVRNFSQRPTGDSAENTGYTGSAGGGKYLLVNEAQSDGSNYVYSETTGNKQGFTYATPVSLLPSNAVVKALVINDLARKVSSGGLKQGVRLGGVDYPESTAKVLKTSYTRETLMQHYMEVRPSDSAPWDGTENPESYLEKTA